MRHILPALLLTAITAATLQGQDTLTVEGDSTVKAAIDAQTRIVYDSAKGWNYQFTTANLMGIPGAHGTEARSASWKGVPIRLIAGGWSPEGQFGAEFYRVDGRLVFVYQSLERFRERATRGPWRNFRGSSGWERRIYLVNDRIAYVETTGDGAPPVTAVQLNQSVINILRLLER